MKGQLKKCLRDGGNEVTSSAFVMSSGFLVRCQFSKQSTKSISTAKLNNKLHLENVNFYKSTFYKPFYSVYLYNHSILKH